MTTEPQSASTTRRAIPEDSFANRLMLARAYAGHLSIRQAAELCDLGRGAWVNWEKGANPSDKSEIAAVVAEKLGVDLQWLLYGGQLTKPERRSLRRTRAERADVLKVG
ncbi:helix-turn-helix transcriptional regulator [Actinoplanes sp. TBRC 11911]|uniref:helix-turn-helix domain-containing protein n=1 Tax=Actinoplanes sp. TBRC 11911 TaxID=2729386 RepID=UPI00145D0F26|nr:helix-turn-helix transcriptional regulator [Actinoplanes sp. TBRC 11911]NMO51984.1 helix-turn-helix transcriptional regulator [Actinoplanes sp. TBRC 11911]